MFSIYTSGFNLIRGNFDWKSALNAFNEFADEVVIAVNTSDDDTLKQVEDFVETMGNDYGANIKIVKTDFSYSDPGLDGKVKNAALQATTMEFKIGLDLDERIPAGQREVWEQFAYNLSQSPEAGSMMIPVVNLYKDEKHVKDVGQKWYLHKHGLYRGVVDFARRPDGTHDITKSDSCELVNQDGKLVHALSAFPIMPPVEYALQVLATNQFPFVVHYGYVDLERRVQLNQTFWKNHWAVEAGHPVDIPTEVAALDNQKTYEHNLTL